MSKAVKYQGFRNGNDLDKGFNRIMQEGGQAVQGGLPIRPEILGDGETLYGLETRVLQRLEAKIVIFLGKVSD